MIATLITLSVMRAPTWSVDVLLLSFAREGAQIRGLLVLKTGWAGFDMDREPQRRLYGNLLWSLRFDLPLARRPKGPAAYVSMRDAYLDLTGSACQPANPEDTQAGNPTTGGEPCTVSKSLPSSSGSPCSTSSGGSGSSLTAGQGDGAPCPGGHLSPAEQAIVDQHRAFLMSIAPELWRQSP